MAMVIRPYQSYSTGGSYKDDLIKALESIGLTDVRFVKETTYSYVYHFKFPDGTQVNQAALPTNEIRYTIVYDLEAHIIVFLKSGWQAERPSPDLYILNYVGMCVLPTSSGDVIEVRYNANDYTKTHEVFNMMKYPDNSDASLPSSCTLLPAYVGLPTGLFEIPNCYTALNATYITGTKFVDETGAKWVSLIGPLLYKVPTIE